MTLDLNPILNVLPDNTPVSVVKAIRNTTESAIVTARYEQGDAIAKKLEWLKECVPGEQWTKALIAEHLDTIIRDVRTGRYP